MIIDEKIKNDLHTLVEAIIDMREYARGTHIAAVRVVRILTKTSDDAKSVIRYLRDTEPLVTTNVEEQQAKYVSRRYAAVINAISERQLAYKLRNGGTITPDITLYLDGTGRPMEVLSTSVNAWFLNDPANDEMNDYLSSLRQSE